MSEQNPALVRSHKLQAQYADVKCFQQAARQIRGSQVHHGNGQKCLHGDHRRRFEAGGPPPPEVFTRADHLSSKITTCAAAPTAARAHSRSTPHSAQKSGGLKSPAPAPLAACLAIGLYRPLL